MSTELDRILNDCNALLDSIATANNALGAVLAKLDVR